MTSRVSSAVDDPRHVSDVLREALNIWQNASEVDFGSGIEFKPALAQQSGGGDAPQSAPGPGDGPADSEGLPPGSRPLEETNEETPIVGDPNRFSEREVQLLQELAERRNVLMRGNSNWKNGKLY